MGSVVQVHPDPPEVIGGVAQLGEHLLCKQGVVGSIPVTSTNRSAEINRKPKGLTSGLWPVGCLLINNLEEVSASVERPMHGL